MAEAVNLAARPLDLLRYRSNLLGADLRITNFGGGNTSSKFTQPDPLTGAPARVLAVKGSGGDLRSIGASGFALLYLDKLEQLIARYRGEAHEDEMVALYPLCAFGENKVAASIDTPLHAFLPFAHVDHLHPDWCIALAASANGATKLAEFNTRYGRRLVWMPWQRPGFELGMMLRRAVEEHPGCEGILLGSHGLFTWGDTQHECYLNSIRTIDQMGEFVEDHARASGRPLFGGAVVTTTVDRDAVASAVLPHLRGVVSSNRRVIAHFNTSDAALTFANSRWAADLCRMGTSCPDHFLRTRICPMFVPWNPADEQAERLQQRIGEQIGPYRDEYVAYYQSCAQADSPRAARLEPFRRRDSGTRRVRLRQGQARSQDYHGVLRQRRARDGRRDGARGERDESGRAAAGAPGRAGARVQELSQLRRAAENARRSASSTGRSKRRSCSGCRRSASSAGRSRSWWAAAAASAVRLRSCWPSEARTSSSPT